MSFFVMRARSWNSSATSIEGAHRALGASPKPLVQREDG